jgi:hypothetical protein
LALQLGRTVEELDETISSAELTQWMAYAGIEPFGYPMDNYRMGVPAAAIVGSIQNTIPVEKGKRRPKPPKASDFYPSQPKAELQLTPEQKEHLRKKHGKRRNSLG